MCDEWLGKDGCRKFCEWSLKNGYEETLTIERIDVNGNYEPSNCKWIPLSEQSNNTRSNVLYSYHGETKNIAQWANEYGFNYHTLYSQLKRGISIEDIIEGRYRNGYVFRDRERKGDDE